MQAKLRRLTGSFLHYIWVLASVINDQMEEIHVAYRSLVPHVQQASTRAQNFEHNSVLI